MEKGSLLFWEVNEFKVNLSDFEALVNGLGITTRLPRNDYRAAMIKALKTFTKGNDKLYRRFNDNKASVSFGVFVQETVAGDITLNREIVFHVSKSTGTVTANAGEIPTTLAESFRMEKDTISSEQFRSYILRHIRKEASAIGMRSGGGIYFIDSRKKEKLDIVKRVFSAFPSNMKLFEIPLYDDQGTLVALEKAVSEDIEAEVKDIIKELETQNRTGVVTKRMLESKSEEIRVLMEKSSFHAENLRGKATEIQDKIKTLDILVGDRLNHLDAGIVDPEDFTALLGAL